VSLPRGATPSSERPVLWRGPLAAGLAALLLVACQVRRGPAPASVALLRIGSPWRLSDRAALSPPAWSPDGKALAYADGQGLWIVSLQGKERKVTAVGVATQVAWSGPTGLLAYIDRGQVFVVHPEGGPRRRLILPAEGAALATHLAWAPGSDELAVAARMVGSPGRSAVWLISADGRMRRQVLPGVGPGGGIPQGLVVEALQWFPDSLFLLIGLGPEGGGGVSRLLRWRIRYPDRRVLPQPFPRIFSPQIAPDGLRIAFAAPDSAGPSALHAWATRVDGSGAPRRLSPQAGRITGLAWAPTSDKVAFARVLDEARGEIWLADVDGGGRVLAAEFRAEFPDPGLPLVVRWSGDGRHLAYGSNSGSYTGPVWVIRLERR